MSDNYSKILGYLSSSEINRCKKNGFWIMEARNNWIEVLKYDWLTRKLRRKIGHLFQLDLLPTIYQPVFGLPHDSKLFAELGEIFAQKYLDAEDEAIMKGISE